MLRLSIRWRLTIWYGIVLAGVLVCFSFVVYLGMQRRLLARTDMELDEELLEVALESRLSKNIHELRQHLLQRFHRHESFDFRVLSVPEGTVLFRSQRLQSVKWPPPAPTQSSTALHETDSIPSFGTTRIASRTVDGPESQLVIQVLTSLAPNQEELRSFALMLLSIGPTAIAVALLGGYWLARKALAPVDVMATAAEQITVTDLSRRLTVLNPDDELGRLTQTLNGMLDRLQASIEKMRRFTADAAHELRTPLAVLRTEAEVCLNSPRSVDEYREVVETTLDETNRLSQLTDQLLLLSREDGGFACRELEPVELDRLLEGVIDYAEGLAEQKGVQFEVNQLDRAAITGDEIRLSQLFFNLLDNAVKYTPTGGKVTVSCRKQDDALCVRIEDTGIGIGSDDLPHIFERFYRAEKSRNRSLGGTGLGLAICRAIAEAHDGTIRADSTLGRGSVFEVIFPVPPDTPGAHDTDKHRGAVIEHQTTKGF